MKIELVVPEKVEENLRVRYKVGDVKALVAELGYELEQSLARGISVEAGPGSRVAEIPTRKIMTGVDYRGILFGTREDPLVAIARPIDVGEAAPGVDIEGAITRHFLLTSIEPASTMRIRGVDFGVAGFAALEDR